MGVACPPRYWAGKGDCPPPLVPLPPDVFPYNSPPPARLPPCPPAACRLQGLLFLSALAAFETRTLYANSSGDHLVGWANSSLRRLGELPPKSGRWGGRRHCGVVVWG